MKKEAEEDLKKINQIIAKKIINRVENYLVKNPTVYGKPLVGDLKGRWSYRFSNYRVVYEMNHSELIILIVEVGHRKDIYDQR